MTLNVDPEPFVETNENRRRLGYFRVRSKMLGQDWAGLKALFEGVIVIEAATDWMRNEVVYGAMSEHFEEIPEAEVVPDYECTIYEQRDRSLRIEWRRSPNSAHSRIPPVSIRRWANPESSAVR